MGVRGTAPWGARALLVTAMVTAGAAAVIAAASGASVGTWVRVGTAVLYLGIGVLGLLLAQHDARSPAAWVLLAGSVGESVLALDQRSDGGFGQLILGSIAAVAVFALFTIGVLLFPYRRRGPTARLLLIVSVVALVLLGAGSVSGPLGGDGNSDGSIVLLAGLLLTVILSPLVAVDVGCRRRRASRGGQRSALVLLEIAAWVNASAFVGCAVIAATGALPPWFGVAAEQTGVVFGICAWIGIVRFRLLGLRATVAAVLPYLAVSAIAVAVASATAATLGAVLSGWADSAVSAALAVLLVLPLHGQLRAMTNLLVYGRRTDPGETLALLGGRLAEQASEQDTVEHALRTIGDALAVRVRLVDNLVDNDEPVTGERLPLLFDGRPVGTLAIDGAVHPADRRTLQGLVPHLAAAVHARRLERALQDSRRLLVSARSAERERIRRDLHDGLGPTLAGIVLGVEGIQRHLADPDRARAELATLHHVGRGAVEEVRRIVYALRPPQLDSLGLDGALREQATRLGAASVETGVLPELPDTLETGVYLIALEAMKNAATHARPGRFWVRLHAAERLALEVSDDGPGLVIGYRPGVGIRSMRERAAELGGALDLLPCHPHGTLVRAEWGLT